MGRSGKGTVKKGPKGGAKRHISSVKRSNQKRNKLVKAGKAKPNSTPRYIPNKKKQDQPERYEPPQLTKEQLQERQDANKRDQERAYQELADSVSEEDRAFLQLNARNLKRKHPKDEENEVDDEEEEEDESDGENEISAMEMGALKRIQLEKDGEKTMRAMLPIKTKEGLRERNIEVSDSEGEEEEEEGGQGAGGGEEKGKQEEAQQKEESMAGREVSIVELYAQRKELLSDRKLHIGSLASNFLEAPEDRLINLEKLVKMVDSDQPRAIEISVHRLAAASVLEILKDVTPGYKIFQIDQDGDKKLKKDTLKLQKYEQGLLRCYKTFLLKLEKYVNIFKSKSPLAKDPMQVKQAEFFLDCMCQLLIAHPHFNFAANILHAISPILTAANPTARETVRKTISEMFKADMRGEISFEAVKLINHLVKSRKHNVRNEVIDVLLCLRIKNVNLDQEKEDEIELKKKEARRRKLMEKNRVSRQEKKRKKKMEALEKELLEARGEEGKKVKEKFFTECTKLVFTIYFRILKSFPRSRLMASVLEGLSKFAHVINLEFFADLIAVFQSLLADGDFLTHRDTLLVVSTVFAILSGQGEALNIDPASFYVHLYTNLFRLETVRTHADVPLAMRSLHDMLVKRKKRISKGRVMGFAKRLATLSLQLLHNGAISSLAVLRQLIITHTAANQLLDSEHEVGSGVFDASVPDPEHSCASNTTAWELALLANHYHGQAATLARHIAAQCPPTGQLSLAQDLKKPAEELFGEYSMEDMAFRPQVQPPPTRKKGKPAATPLVLLAAATPPAAATPTTNSPAVVDFYAAVTTAAPAVPPGDK